MDNNLTVAALCFLVAAWLFYATQPLWRPWLDGVMSARASLASAQEEAERARVAGWDASYRCYDLCEPPAYKRKAEGYSWLGRFEG